MSTHSRPTHDPVAIILIAMVLLILALSPVCAPRGSAAQRCPPAQAGELFWCRPDGMIPLPRGETEVELAVTGVMVHGTVTQTFLNSSSEPIEVLYTFPLPDRAAVYAMEMRIGERRIVADVAEREQAKEIYETAKERGRRAALLDQERPNLFTTSAANIEPGEGISIRLEYVEELTYQCGEYLLTFPLTFTPRFIPSPHADAADGPIGSSVPDADRITPPFLKTGDERRMQVMLRVLVDAGVPIARLDSPSHDVHVTHDGTLYEIVPTDGTVRADRDFELRWTLASGDEPRGALFTESGPHGRYGLLMVVPPIAGNPAARPIATETCFVIDVSGSMKGPSIRQARTALLAALERMRPGDLFHLLKFSDANEAFRPSTQDAGDREAVGDARRWVRRLEASGGTNILPALQRAVSMIGSTPAEHSRRIILLTDGAVGNESALLEEFHRRRGDIRLHVIGIGRAPNSYVTRRLAAAGRGRCEFIHDVRGAEASIDQLLERLSRPLMTDLSLAECPFHLSEVDPDPLPDLYPGEPLLVSFRLGGVGTGPVTLAGRVGGGEFRISLPLREPPAPQSGVAVRWARARVRSLMDDLAAGSPADEIRSAVIAVARPFHLVTRYTSLVAVETNPSTEGPIRTVRMPNTLPSGSHLLGLPCGGTCDALKLWLGLACLALGLGVGTGRRTWARCHS